jgi:hypothetical protein
VREIVIVISDLYLPAASEGGPLGSIAVPGLEHAARFGATSLLENDWRAWLAQWLGREELVGAAPASVAAAGVAGGRDAAARTAWIATPVHLVAGMTSLHLERRSILRPSPAELAGFAADFQSTFQDSGFHLEPLESGDFLMLGPGGLHAQTTEPARSMGGSVADALPGGTGAAPLRRLGAEIEMWLHEHPVNVTRTNRGEPPVSALWLWGGGPASLGPVSLRRADGNDAGPQSGPNVAVTDLAFGTDAYLRGLWRLHAGDIRPLPEQFDALFGYPLAQRAVLVMEVGQVLHSDPKQTLFDAVAELDRRFISPALKASRRGEVERVALVANDRQLVVRARDRVKLWRRPRPGLEGLR